MQPVAALFSSQFDLHDMPGHPESATRTQAVIKLLRERAGQLGHLKDLPFQAATHDELALVHDLAYINELERTCAFGGGLLDRDTYVTESSFDVAALAAGACLQATRAVLTGDVARALVLPRPPGHHAFADHPEGFCIFNNVALAARLATQTLGLGRVMIVDWDVHHGNGTQAIFARDPNVLFVSMHQRDIYPGSGDVDEIGIGAGRGSTLNLPLPDGVGDAGYAKLFDQVILPKARRFQPEMVLISAGFDAHWRDPLASESLSLHGFAALGERVIALANALCAGRVIAVLEGGYDREVLAHAVYNLAWQLGDGDPSGLSDPIGPNPLQERTNVDGLITRAREVHGLDA